MLISSFIFNSTTKSGDGSCRKPGLVASYLYYVYAILVIVGALMLFLKCNDSSNIYQKVLLGLLIVLFPEIYLATFIFRKYIFKEPGYCKAI